jgi:beta-1,4-mannosyltransferase
VALFTLAFDRPVLLPCRGAALEYRDAAGDNWVHTCEGCMRPSVLAGAFDVDQPQESPDLAERYNWSSAATALYEAYEDLLQRSLGVNFRGSHSGATGV